LGLRLVADPVECLNYLGEFVKTRCLAGCPEHYQELTRLFGDEFAFLDFSARQSNGLMRVLIEFGVSHKWHRHRNGFFDAYWETGNARFGQIHAVLLNAEVTTRVDFVTALQPSMTLPLLNMEVADVAA
jgi:hypothetical protein